jgi:flagellar hook-length control protein FliK
MSTFIVPSAPAASSQPLTSSGTRGRNADEAQGRRFGDVLERSRAGARKSDASPGAAPAETAAALSKPERGTDNRKDDLVSDLLAFALFAPAPVATQAPAAATLTAGAPGEAKAAVSTVTNAAADPLLAQTPAADLSDAGTEAAASTLPAAQDAAPEAQTLPAKAAAARADTAKALPATLDTSAADVAAPAAVAAMPLPPAASATPAAQAGDATAVTPAAQQQAKATPALPAAAELKTAPVAAVAAGAERSEAAAAPAPATPPLVAASTSFVPQAVERAGAPAAATPVLSVAPPVGSDEWGPAVGRQMLRMSTGGHQVAELNLNPAGLGPLKVTLSLGDNQAQAMFVSAHESVRKAVEAALPQLRSTLAEQGISLGQTSVGAESRPWAGQGGFGQQPQQQQSSPSRQAEYPGSGRSEAAAVAAPRSTPAAQRSSGLDTFA